MGKHGNHADAVRRYREKYLYQRRPNHCNFTPIDNWLWELRTFHQMYLDVDHLCLVCNVWMEGLIWEGTKRQPAINTRPRAAHASTSHTSMHHTLQEQQICPGHRLRKNYYHMMHLQTMHSVRGFCNSQPKALHLYRDFIHGWILLHLTEFTYIHKCSQMEILIQCKINFPSACGLEFYVTAS